MRYHRSINRVMKLLPHRYPFLLVDRIIDMDRDESAIGIKSVSINEPFFQGHFPNFPIMPGVLIIGPAHFSPTAMAGTTARRPCGHRRGGRLLRTCRQTTQEVGGCDQG